MVNRATRLGDAVGNRPWLHPEVTVNPFRRAPVTGVSGVCSYSGFVFEMMVPRDGIELSTPGSSATRTDVRRYPRKSIIVFKRDLKSRVASGVGHQHPGTKVSAKVSFAMLHAGAHWVPSGWPAAYRATLETPLIERANRSGDSTLAWAERLIHETPGTGRKSREGSRCLSSTGLPQR